jgi:hypothetical protein
MRYLRKQQKGDDRTERECGSALEKSLPQFLKVIEERHFGHPIGRTTPSHDQPRPVT